MASPPPEGDASLRLKASPACESLCVFERARCPRSVRKWLVALPLSSGIRCSSMQSLSYTQARRQTHASEFDKQVDKQVNRVRTQKILSTVQTKTRGADGTGRSVDAQPDYALRSEHQPITSKPDLVRSSSSGDVSEVSTINDVLPFFFAVDA